MKWNWEVFLKSWLFAFLGFLIGVVSTVIYLAVDVDLSKLDGLQILTAVLIAITIWYVYTKKLSEIKESLMNSLINHYYSSVFIFMMVFLLFSILLMRTLYNDIATNLFAEAIGIIITLFFLIILVKAREEFKWKIVENLVYEYLGREIDGIFTDFSNLCDLKEPSFEGNINTDFDEYFKTKMEMNLQELKNKDNIILHDLAKEPLKKGLYGDLFIRRNDNLKEFIQLYFKFLDSSIVKSLIIIRRALNLIETDIIIMKNQNDEELLKWFQNDEDFFNHIKSSMANIFTEIDSLRSESDLKIYY